MGIEHGDGDGCDCDFESGFDYDRLPYYKLKMKYVFLAKFYKLVGSERITVRCYMISILLYQHFLSFHEVGLEKILPKYSRPSAFSTAVTLFYEIILKMSNQTVSDLLIFLPDQKAVLRNLIVIYSLYIDVSQLTDSHNT